MARERQEKKQKKGSPAWMTTYGDMMTLLLVFFVFLISIMETKVEDSRLQLILSAFSGSFGLFRGGLTLAEGNLAEMGNLLETLPAKEKGDRLAKSVEKAVSIFEPEVKSRKVKITEDERGIVISLVSDAFFQSGSAELTAEGEVIVDKLGGFLSSSDFDENMIRVEGHTDNIQPGGTVKERYDTNWELSSGRAITIVKRFENMRGIQGEQLEVVGYGEYQPVESNDIEEGRAYTRRVEIVIMRKKEHSVY